MRVCVCVCVCVYVQIWKLFSWDIFQWDVRVPSGIGVSQYILLNGGFYGVIQLCILVKVTHLLCYSSWGILTVYRCTSKVFIHYVFRMGWWAQYSCRMKELKYDHRCSCYFPLNWSSHNIHNYTNTQFDLFIYLWLHVYMHKKWWYCTAPKLVLTIACLHIVGTWWTVATSLSLFVFLSEWGLQFYTTVCEPLPP